MSAETFETAAVEQLVDEHVDQVDEPVLDEPAPIEAELLPASDAGFELDMVHQGHTRRGAALIFALLAGMGLLLALVATPLPAQYGGWVFAAVGTLAALLQVAGGEAR